MTISHYDTQTLLGVIDALDRPSKALASVYLRSEFGDTSESIAFDKINSSRKIAPYVSPLVAGRVIKSKSEKVTSFKPAYVKPKHVLDPTRTIKRRPGERLAGGLTHAERFGLNVADILREQDEMIARREEVMAIEVLRTGKVVVASDDFPAMEVDFERNAAHTVALTGGARWGEPGVKILDNLKTWAETVQKNSGAHPYHVTLDPKAASLLTADPDIKAILDIQRQVSGILELAGVAVGGMGKEFRRVGAIGDFEFYVYQQYYHDASGTLQQMMPDNTVIMGNPELSEGWQAYGAIMDHGSLQAEARFPKMWDDDDPSVTYIMTQSAPLPVVGRVDATLCATVR